MTMKLTALTIAPKHKYTPFGADNPLCAVVKLNSADATVECVLSDDTMRKMLDLVADEVAASAARNMRDFVEAVTSLDAKKSTALLT